jgi:hypothetical protein
MFSLKPKANPFGFWVETQKISKHKKIVYRSVMSKGARIWTSREWNTNFRPVFLMNRSFSVKQKLLWVLSQNSIFNWWPVTGCERLSGCWDWQVGPASFRNFNDFHSPKFWNSKQWPSWCPKFFKFCIEIVWLIGNNFPFCTNFKFH